MWNEILVRKWEYDWFSHIKFLTIASILNQIKTQESNVIKKKKKKKKKKTF